MSLTIQQIITDARRLARRLKDSDTVADILLNETNAIHKKIDAMKQFQDEVEQLNDVANQKPHSQLIANIQKENRHLREIQQENKELRATLEEYQTTLEHIMFKYREHTTDKIYKTKVNFQQTFQSQHHDGIIRQQADKIEEMAAVMQKAALLDEEKSFEDEEIVTMLKTENEGLREMLRIANKFGSTKYTEDKNIQTENSM